MSRHSILLAGKRRDIAFRKKYVYADTALLRYSLYVGEDFWGFVYDRGGSWTAVAWVPGQMNLVDGFKRRWDAALYIINYTQAVDR